MPAYVHPNRVYVNELPVSATPHELKRVFGAYNVGIRTVRILETGGTSNYGFVTFNSREEAERIIKFGKSERGIVIAGKRVTVQQAYSRNRPARRNSGQLSAALQHLASDFESQPLQVAAYSHEQSTNPMAQQQQAYQCQYATAYEVPQEYAAQEAYRQFMQSGYWDPAQPIYVTTAPQNPGTPSATSPYAAAAFPSHYPPTSPTESQATPWVMSNGQVYSMGSVEPSQAAVPAQYFIPQQTTAVEPIEAMEAPSTYQWISGMESASTQPAESSQAGESVYLVQQVPQQQQQHFIHLEDFQQHMNHSNQQTDYRTTNGHARRN